MKEFSFIFLSLTLAVLFLRIAHAENEQTGSETTPQIIKTITVDEAHTIIQNHDNGNNLVIIDVRTPEEFNNEHMQDATNIDYYSDDFNDELNKLDKTKTYVIHCRSGSRSAKALEIMKELGFREVYNMGGIIQWKENGFPTTK